jgi:hypothetical protein
MILRLAAALDVPLRDRNGMLRAAGLEPEFPEPPLAAGMPAVEQAIARMAAQHEPFPLLVVNGRYDVLRANEGATRLLRRLLPEAGPPASAGNLPRLVFDPDLLRPVVVEWERTARALLARLHRESLARPGDAELAALVRALLDYPGVPSSWRRPDLSAPSEPTLGLRLRLASAELGFLSTVTAFSAPQNVTLDELRIESYFPADDATARACAALAVG